MLAESPREFSGSRNLDRGTSNSVYPSRQPVAVADRGVELALPLFSFRTLLAALIPRLPVPVGVPMKTIPPLLLILQPPGSRASPWTRKSLLDLHGEPTKEIIRYSWGPKLGLTASSTTLIVVCFHAPSGLENVVFTGEILLKRVILAVPVYIMEAFRIYLLVWTIILYPPTESSENLLIHVLPSWIVLTCYWHTRHHTAASVLALISVLFWYHEVLGDGMWLITTVLGTLIGYGFKNYEMFDASQ